MKIIRPARLIGSPKSSILNNKKETVIVSSTTATGKNKIPMTAPPAKVFKVLLLWKIFRPFSGNSEANVETAANLFKAQNVLGSAQRNFQKGPNWSQIVPKGSKSKRVQNTPKRV